MAEISRNRQNARYAEDVVNVKDFDGLAEAISAVPSGGSVYIPQGYSETISSTITINKSVTIYSKNREGASITCPDNAPLFEGSGTVTQFILEGISFIGGAGTSQCLRVLNAASWFEGRVYIKNNRFNSFGEFALEFEDSVYTREISGNRFDNCNGCMKEGWASDSAFIDNQTNDLEGTNPVLHIVGGSKSIIAHNIFIPGTGSGTGEDILLDPNSNFGRGGRVYVHHNKFGGEGEKANRVKVRAYNATTSNRSTDVTFSYNQMHGALQSEGGVSTAFKIDNPVTMWDISHNEFDDMDIIIDDNFTSSTGQFGGSVVTNNRYFNATRLSLKLFKNGGRGFTRVNEPSMGLCWGMDIKESPVELRNRISYSSLLTSWNRDSGVTVTGSQTDPFGGTDAALFTADGTIASQSFYRVIDKTTAGAWATDRLIAKFWLKEGTANQMVVGLKNNTDSVWAGSFEYLSVTEEWRQYELVFNGLDNTKTYSLHFYITESDEAAAGTVYLYAPQVSEYNSDYVPTPLNIGVADTSVCRRFMKGISVGNTGAFWTSGSGTPESVITAPVGSMYTRTDGGASTTLYVKETGTGNTGWVAK